MSEKDDRPMDKRGRQREKIGEATIQAGETRSLVYTSCKIKLSSFPNRFSHRLSSWISIFYLFQLFFSPAPAFGESSSCPIELEPLVEAMLPELPGYINRELQRSRSAALAGSRLIGDPNASTSTILAGRPEFEPLPPGTDRSTIPMETNPEEAVSQAFITTLERTYINDEILEFQGYHWLFLTPSPNGWRLVLIFSSWGSLTDGTTTPPQDSSNSAVGQGIRTWLRNCRYSAKP